MSEQGAGRGQRRVLEVVVGLALLALAAWGVSVVARDGSTDRPTTGSGPVTSSSAPAGPTIVGLDPAAAQNPATGPGGPVAIGPAPQVAVGGVDGGPSPDGPRGMMVGGPPAGPDPVDPDASANKATGVRGRVVATSGAPVAGATVQLRGTRPGADGSRMMIMRRGPDGEMEVSSPGETRSRSAVTAADGTFEVLGLDASYRYELEARPAAEPASGLLVTKRAAPRLTASAVVDAGDVPLRRGASVSGVVSDPDGRPVQNALVRLGGDGPFLMGGPPDGEDEGGEGKPRMTVGVRRSVSVARPMPAGGGDEEGDGPMAMPFPGQRQTRTDAAGRYVLDRLPPGKQELTASARGLRASKVSLELSEGEALVRDVRLAPPLAVSVRVTDPAGTPIQGARVEAHVGFGPAGRGASAVTDTSGTVTLRGLGSSEVMLTVEADGCARVTQEAQLGPADPETPRLVMLRPGAVVTGRLVRTDGTPVEGAMVFVEPAVHGGDVDVVAGDDQRSDASGHFTVKGVAPGAWRLRAHAPRLAQASAAVTVPPAAGRVDLGDVRMGDLGTVEVIVQDPDGAVAEGAVVEAGRGDGGMMIMVATATTDGGGPPGFTGMGSQGKTDASGVGRVAGLEPGRYTVRASKAGFADGWAEVEVGGGAEPARATVRLTRGATIAVRVSGRGGRAAPERVGLALERKGRHMPVAQATAQAGSATFERVAPGEYRIGARGTDEGRGEADKGWFTVADGESITRAVEVDVGVTVDGVVRRADGTPVPGAALELGGLDLWHPGEARVMFASAKATADASGRYRFSAVHGDDGLGVSVVVDGRTSVFRLAIAGDADLHRDLILPAADAKGSVRGRAWSTPASGPAAGATLLLERLDPDGPIVRREQTVGADGAATFEAVPDGRYALSAVAPGLARSRIEVQVAGAAVEPAALALDRGVALVLDLPPPARPSPGPVEARVMVRPASGGEASDLRFATAELGRALRIDGLATDAEFEVQVDAPGFATWRAKLRGALEPAPTRVDLRPE